MSMDPGLEAAWAVLGLAADADRDQVTRAYRRLALSTHPDVSPSPDAAARFAAVTNAYRRVVEAAGESFAEPAGTDTTTTPRQPPSSRGTPRAWAEDLVWIHVSTPMVHAQFGVPIVAGPVQVQPPSDPERPDGAPQAAGSRRPASAVESPSETWSGGAC
jgi:hypothetical protein